MSRQTRIKYPVARIENPLLKVLDERVVKEFLVAYGNSNTQGAYRNGIRVFKAWAESLSSEFQGINLLVNFKTYLQKRMDSPFENEKISSYSAGLYLTIIKKYVKFLYEHGLIGHNPAESVKGFRRHNTHFRRALDRNNEMPKFLAAIDTTTDIGLRDYAIVSLLAHTGIRSFELAGADYGDIDKAEGRPILWVRSKGKSGKSEYVFITDRPYGALMQYLEKRKCLTAQSPLFLGVNHRSGKRMTTRAIRYRIDFWLQTAGLKTARITVHSLRHTAAITALKNGADIRAVQGMLRHSDPKTTMVYLQDISRQDKPAEDIISFGT